MSTTNDIEIEDKDELIAQLQNIIALMPGHVYWYNRNNIILGCNDKQAKYLGLKNRNEIIGKTVYDFLASQDAETLDEINNHVMETGEIYEAEESATINNDEVTFVTQKAPLRSKNGEIVGIVGVSMDITRRVKAEKDLLIAKERAEAANEAKMRFLATMSHELRTPLNGIVGLGDLLRQTKLTKKQKDFINRIVDNGCYLSALVSDILMFAKLDAGKVELNPQPFNLAAVVESVTQDLSHLVEEIPDLNLEYKLNNQIPLQMMGDAIRIRQIIVNLVNNAVKFTESGLISVTLTALEKEKDIQKFEILVQDTGKGIPANKLDKIFDRFYQADKKDVHIQSMRGLGLGLAIVKELVELMNGTIEVSSEVNKGTLFRLVIPFKVLESDSLTFNRSIKNIKEPVQPYIAKPQLKPKKTKMHALLVEDEPLNQLVAVNILKELGFEADLATTGEMAKKQMLEKQYDVILMDMQLPDMSGAQVTQWLRNQTNNPKNFHTPVIAVTGHALPEEVSAFKEAGVVEILVKPIMIFQVSEALVKAKLR